MAPPGSHSSAQSDEVHGDAAHFQPTKMHLLVGVIVLVGAAITLLAVGPPASELPLFYLAAETVAAVLAAVCTFQQPRLALAVQALVGAGVYSFSAVGETPVWTYRFGADREALQLFFKYVMVFGLGTLALALYKLGIDDARRRKYATHMACFVGLVLVGNMLWTLTYECAYNPVHCWLLRCEAVVLAAWLGGRLLSCLCTETPMVETSYWRVIERRKTAPAHVYVTGLLSIEWIAAYTAWNVGFVLEHFTDVVVIQDLTFWATMLYYRWRDEQPRGLHAYFYEARAVSLGAHMTVSALFGAVAPMASPWVSSRGSYEQYAPEGTLSLMRFLAAANFAASVAYALPACASAWRATMVARERLRAGALPLPFKHAAMPSSLNSTSSSSGGSTPPKEKSSPTGSASRLGASRHELHIEVTDDAGARDEPPAAPPPEPPRAAAGEGAVRKPPPPPLVQPPPADSGAGHEDARVTSPTPPGRARAMSPALPDRPPRYSTKEKDAAAIVAAN